MVFGIIAKSRTFLSAFMFVVTASSLLYAQRSEAALDEKTITEHQTIRDDLFRKLKVSATQYTFEYVVIYMPADTVPGIHFPIPVSHIRYKSAVFFAFDRYDLAPSAAHVLSDLTQIILRDPALRSLLVVGHTDTVGEEKYNSDLSLKRAAAVASKLHTAGVKEDYISLIPMGKAQPVATNSTDEGRALNRRVEFFISDVPAAAIKAVQSIPFNPCFRNDNEHTTTGCDNTITRIPIYSGYSGRMRPRLALEIQGTRPKLPDIILQRPSLRDLNPPSHDLRVH